MNEQTLFAEALERADPQERAAFLDQACQGDPALRARIERLLAQHEHAGGFLESPPVQLTATIDEPATERPGTVIGPYKLLEQIGEGGMGTVWMAQQTEPVKRLVAVKLIKAGMDSRQVIARFEAERQALALMDHANIARVLDGGTTGAGRPYFVMDLVKGVPITRYCDEHRLMPRQRLELFLPVCQAIQHAHLKGIIHRDLKPSNVLVALYDGNPVPKVIDFGVAKAAGQLLTDRTLVTGFGNIVGTLEYMSPEQAEINQLDIDTRSDIYSLGVLLYELLAGSPPFTRKESEKGGMVEMLRLIREQEPTKPSAKLSTAEGLPTLAANRGMEPAKLARLVRGELDWIVMKALEKDRSRRYETANGFAMDVQRYLADEPVLACPPSVLYRLKKFVRRNKTGLAVSGLVLAFLVILGADAGWTLRDRAAREHEVAQESARKLARTEEGIRQALERAGNSLGELHAALKKPGGVQELLNQPARWELYLRMAQAELTQAQRLRGSAEGELDAEVIQALGELEKQLAADQADHRLALRLETVRLDRMIWIRNGFDFRTAEEYPEAFAAFEVLTRKPEDAAARLAASLIKEQLVAALDDWAWVANKRKQKELAALLLEVARRAAPDAAWGDRLRQVEVWDNQEALARLVAETPPAGLSPQLACVVAQLLGLDHPLAVAWLRRAQAEYPADFWLALDLGNAIEDVEPAEAAVWYRVALAIRPTNATAYSNLGLALRDQKKYPEAIAAYHKALALNPTHALAHNGLGLVFQDQGKLNDAIDEYRKAIEFAPKNSVLQSNLGEALAVQGKLNEAVEAFRKAIQLNGRDAPAYSGLGFALRLQNKLDDAAAACRQAIDIDPNCVQGHFRLGEALQQQQKWADAAAAYETVIRLDPKDALAYCNLGRVRSRQDKLEAAVAAHRKAVQLDPNNATFWCSLGYALFRQKELNDAIAAYQKAIDIDPKYVGAYGTVLAVQGNHEAAADAYRSALKFDANNATVWYNLGLALKQLQKLNDAVAAFQKAIDIDPKVALYHYNLGLARCEQRQVAEAIAPLRKALELDPQHDRARYRLALCLTYEAWVLATHAEPERRDPDRAVSLAKEAVELKPQIGNGWSALGAAHYRALDWDAAIAALEESTKRRNGGDSFDWFFRAMAHWQLGEKDKAREWYDKAVQWMDKNKPTNEELRRFRAEASELLELKEKK